MAKNTLDVIALLLLIVGGLNWGFAVFDFNLVFEIFGDGIFAKIIYGLVGLSALYCLKLFKA